LGGGSAKEAVFRVYRYDPERDREPGVREYGVPARKGLTVLDALIYIKSSLDPTLAIRYSCGMATCGSCGMVINGVPRLACETQVLELGDTIEVKPMYNYGVIKDLVSDLDPLFEKHSGVKPYVIRGDEELEKPTREYLQTPGEAEQYIQFSYCIKCGLCLAACPTVDTDRLFLGPQALASAYRYIADTRDGGLAERLNILDGLHGVWRCHFAGGCSAVCPKGVDPALAIQLLKGMILSSKLGFKGRGRTAQLALEPRGV